MGTDLTVPAWKQAARIYLLGLGAVLLQLGLIYVTRLPAFLGVVGVLGLLAVVLALRPRGVAGGAVKMILGGWAMVHLAWACALQGGYQFFGLLLSFSLGVLLFVLDLRGKKFWVLVACVAWFATNLILELKNLLPGIMGVLLLFPRSFQKPFKPQPELFFKLLAFGGVMNLLTIGRLALFYTQNKPELSEVVNQQKGVRVLYPSNSKLFLSTNPRFYQPSCQKGKFWVGAFYDPYLSLITSSGKILQSIGPGKPTDLMVEDCEKGVVVLGNNQLHEILILDNQSLEVRFSKQNIGGRPSYVASDLEKKVVWMSEDIGYKTWKIDYKDLDNPKIEEFPIAAVDLLPTSQGLLAPLHGQLAMIDPDTMEIIKKSFLPVTIQPQVAVDQKRKRIFVSDILGGRVWVYGLDDLSFEGSIFVGVGVRYLYFDQERDALISINYLNGLLKVWKGTDLTLFKELFVGERGRAVAESLDGKEIYFPTRPGIVAVDRDLWRWKN